MRARSGSPDGLGRKGAPLPELRDVAGALALGVRDESSGRRAATRRRVAARRGARRRRLPPAERGRDHGLLRAGDGPSDRAGA